MPSGKCNIKALQDTHLLEKLKSQVKNTEETKT